MNLRKSVLLAGLVVSAFVVTGCNREESVATVNGETITMKEFMEHVKTKGTIRVTFPNGGPQVEAQIADTLAYQATQDLISRKILLQLAKDDKVAPTAEDVNKEIEFRKKLQPSFVSNLEQRGLSLGGIRRAIEVELAQERILTKDIKVTDAEVDAYIKNNPKEFVDPARAELIYIRANTIEKREQIQRELDSGKAFKTVAATMSDDPNARRSQGRFAESRLDAFAPALRSAVDATSVGRTTEWLMDGTSSVKFMVDSKTPEKPLTIDETRREFVRRQIAINRGRQAIDLPKRIAERVKDGNVKITDPVVSRLWDGFVKDVQAESALPTP
ncbi:MAG: SurA N-terminal domain-containing protein [Fimbriimonadaceae bacterium]|jgi:foldase protein PrsA|nr:SurA N-terminal domain-containing protein [Fimbriimonadaceae bacterium]